MIGISDDRLKHSVEVARLMKQRAEEAGWPKEKCEEMFVLGWLHDIGYEFSEKQSDHAENGGAILKAQGYRYWREVSLHGKINVDYASDELQLLNTVDMCINSRGERVDIDTRLRDIASRYGEDSIQYKEACIFSAQIGLIKEE